MARGRIRLPQSILENTARPAAARTRHPAGQLAGELDDVPAVGAGLPRGADPLAALNQHLIGTREHMDEIAQAMRNIGAMTGPPVLETGTAVLDALGGWSADRYRIPFKSIAVVNATAAALTVASMGRQGSAPGVGAGVVIVPANTFLSLNLEGSALSFYGTPGATVTYSVMAGRVQPDAGAVNPAVPVTPGAGIQAAGPAATGPAAGATITSVVLPAGPFLVSWSVSLGAGAVAAADANNMQMLLGATVILPALLPAVANVVEAQAPVQVVGPGTLAVKAIGAATATAVYDAQISAVPVQTAY